MLITLHFSLESKNGPVANPQASVNSIESASISGI